MSTAAAIAAASPALSLLGIQLCNLLLWAAAHGFLLHGFIVLCKAVGAFFGLVAGAVRLVLVWPRLKNRFGRW